MIADATLTRRAFAAGLGLALAAPSRPWAQAASSGGEAWQDLTAAPQRLRLQPDPAPEVEGWVFNGQVPGPVLRVRHGEEARIRLVNRSGHPLSLHWHGVRNVSAMDGVGGLTQEPVAPEASFDYRFTPPDAGTFLVRPLVRGRSSEAGGRGLSTLLVVDERDAPPFDREVIALCQDWRFAENGALAPFGELLEAATGRLGSLFTVNGRPAPERVTVAPGSRLRLRLANACNARVMPIRFDGMKAYVAAVDGQPTDTFEPLRATLPFSPGTRYDLVLEAPEEAGGTGRVIALVGGGVALVEVVAGAEARRGGLPPIRPLSPNAALPPAIKLQDALRRDVVVAGGARPGADGKLAYDGDPTRIWTMNGAAGSAANPPLFRAKRDQPVVLALNNQTPFVQPLHVHGHVFRLLHPFDDGWEPYWLDTVQVPANRTLRIAFNADNPGRWALSATVLERFDAGLWTWFEVA